MDGRIRTSARGFSLLSVNVDGASVPDPGTKYFYGCGTVGGVELKFRAHDEDFYALKDCTSWFGERIELLF